MLIHLEIDKERNEAIMVFTDKRAVKISSGPDTDIERFLEWFFSPSDTRLLNNETYAVSLEDTQIINLEEVA